MPIVYSDVMPTDRWQAEQWYNTLDCCVTVEIHEALAKDPAAQATYAFERGLQGILLDMMLTGFRRTSSGSSGRWPSSRAGSIGSPRSFGARA
jgi:hypothetical protein